MRQSWCGGCDHSVTEVGTGTVEKPWAQTRNETAWESLQDDAVQRMRKR